MGRFKRRLQKWLGIEAIAEEVAELRLEVFPLSRPVNMDSTGWDYPESLDGSLNSDVLGERINKGYEKNNF